MSSRGANVTVTIGAAFAGSFKSVLREADRELKNFGKRATKSMKSFGAASAKAAKSVSAIGAAGKDMTVLATQGRKAARVTKAISTSTVKMSKAQVRAAKAMGGANGNSASIMGLPSKAMLRDAERTMKKYQRVMKPVAANDLREIATAMPKAYKQAVRGSVKEIRRGARQMARAANGNAGPAMAGMPSGFGRATRGVPGVTTGSRPPKAANGGAPSPSQRRTASGIPAVGRGTHPGAAMPWGAGGGGRGGGGAGGGARGGGSGRGGRRGHGGAVPGNPTGYHNAPHQHRTNVHSHDSQAIVGGIGAAVSGHTMWDAVKSAGSMNDLQVLLKLQGRTQAEITEATQAAQRIAQKNPNISSVDAMKSIIDVADTGDRDMKKAARLAPFIANSAKMVALVGDEAMKKNLGEGQSRYLGRAIEDVGKGTKSEGEIKDYVNAVTAGTIATRGIFNPEQLYGTIQKSGGIARGWSNEFTGEVLPALTMAMGGAGAGDATYMYGKNFVKGQMQLSSAKAMMEMGLINKKDLLYDGGKYLGVNPDSMPNAQQFRSNPYEAFRNTVIPAALKSAGVNDVGAERKKFYAEHANDKDMAGMSEDDRKVKMIDKFKEHIDNLLQTRTDTFAKAKNFSKMIADFIAQDEQIQAMIAQIRKQPKNAIDVMMGENFTAQIDKIQNSFHTLMTALGAPEVGPAIAAMNSIANVMNTLATASAMNPGATQKVMAAFGAITAGFAAVSLAGITATVLTAAGPFGLALGAVAAGIAVWAAMDWDGFSESMSKLLSIGQALASVLSFFDSIGEDAKGNSLIGKAVSALTGNTAHANSEKAYEDKFKDVEAAKAQLSRAQNRQGGLPLMDNEKKVLEANVARAEQALKDQGEANIAFAKKKQRKKEREDRALKAVSDVEQAKKEMADKASAAKAMEEHAKHSDDDLTKRINDYTPKKQIPLAPKAGKKKHTRPGQNNGAKPPISAENVVAVASPNPGATAGAHPGAAAPHAAAPAAPTGGRMTVDLAGPVSIKDDVGVKQPLRLVTPVLISAQGIINVHDAELTGTMSGVSAAIAGMAGTLSGILAACNGIIGAINAKQFTVNMPAGAGGSAGSAGASRERQSFSD